MPSTFMATSMASPETTPLLSSSAARHSHASYTQPPTLALRVRIRAVCPDIHCPSCISHLSSLVTASALPASSRTTLEHVAVSLIGRSVELDLSLLEPQPSASIAIPVPQHRQVNAHRARLVDILAHLACLLSSEGYPVDSVHVETLPTGGRPRSAGVKVDMTLDADDLYPHARPELQQASSTLPSHSRTPFCPNSYEQPQSRSLVSTISSSLANALVPRSARREQRAKQQEEQQRWIKHIEACASCRQVHAGPSSEVQTTTMTIAAATAAAVAASTADTKRRVRAQLTIGGMTCASCVRSVHAAVDALAATPDFPADLIDDFQVNLMSNSATFQGCESALHEVRAAIEDAGFDVEVVDSQVVCTGAAAPPRDSHQGGKEGQRFVATLAVKGMTCASCVNSIRGAVQAYQRTRSGTDAETCDVDEFNINLLEGSATLSVRLGADASEEEAVALRKEAMEAIEDCGFDVELVSWILAPSCAAADAPSVSTTKPELRRTVRIRIDGMFCHHCVFKVRNYLLQKQANHPDVLEASDDALDNLSLERPVVDVTYVSGASADVSLRTMLHEMSELDASFSASYAPPPSLASRSAELARKELRSLLVRLCVATVFALPTLIVSMVSPMLLSPHHPLNRWFNAHAWGGATRGEVAMWMIATPVQFGVGSIFFKRAYKSLAAVWRKGRRWSERLLRFGNMDVLVALGTAVAYFSSLAVLVVDMARGPQLSDGDADAEMGMTYFEVSVFLIFFILLGRVMESVSKKKTGDAVSELGKMKPTSALLVLDAASPRQSATQKIAVELVEVGDLVLVLSGESPPLDGQLVTLPNNVSGALEAQLDESSLSGEARPVGKSDGDSLYAGTVNVSAFPILCRVQCLPGHAMIDDILGIVREASGRKASIEQLADAITGIFVPCIVYFSLFVLLLWMTLLYSGTISQRWMRANVPHYGEPGARLLYALQFGISCLLVSCPCAIGLAAPTAQLVGIGLASQQGVLVNGGGEAFRSASKAARRKRKLVVVFDKTGTITRGEAGKVVESLFVNADTPSVTIGDEEALLHCIDQAEQASGHPLAASLRTFCAERLGASEDAAKRAVPSAASILQLQDVREEAGHGMRATYVSSADSEEGFELLVGSRRLLGDAWTCPPEVAEKEIEWQESAKTVVFVATRPLRSEPGGDRTVTLCGALAIADTLRPEAKWTISHLEQRYAAEVWMVSGDNARTALAVARQVGIDAHRVVAGVLPTGKKEWVERLQQPLEHEPAPATSRRLVCFVGDGINDSPALASSDLGVALGSGSSLAHSSADFILLQRHAPLLSLPTLLDLSSATDAKIRTNFAWAFVFNLTLVPLAAGILVPLNVTLGPELSGLAMALSSSLVVANSVSLRSWKPPKAVASMASKLS
ncbi:hypothetical protein ACQY0O_006397 [Thecaphora frezii]